MSKSTLFKKGFVVTVIVLLLSLTFYPGAVGNIGEINNKHDQFRMMGNMDVLLANTLLKHENVRDSEKIVNTNVDVFFGEMDTPFFNISELAEFGQTAYGLTSADFNDDGLVDFGVSWATCPFNYAGISIFYNNGNEEFTEDVVLTFSHTYIKDLDSGDYDNDGDIDLLFTYNEHVWYNGWPVNVNGTVNLLRNDGENNFETWDMIAWLGPGIPYDNENRINPHVTSADFDKDGDIDFLVGSNSGKVEFFKNDGTGNFTHNSTIYDFGHISWGITSADFNNDGWIDFIVACEETDSRNGHIYLKLNNKSLGCFDHTMGEVISDLPPQMDIALGGLGSGCLISLDYNDDGNMDFFYASSRLAILYMNKNDVFEPFYVCLFPDNPEGYAEDLRGGGLTVADFNSDGLDDVITGGVQGVVRLFTNNLTLVAITQPEDRVLYVFGEKKFRLKDYGQRIVIGKINVVAKELEPLQKVEFYLDNKLVFTDDTSPFEWNWDRFSFGRHKVKAVAYDLDGNEAGFDDTIIWKFL
jgi:hypothetical protein